MVSLLPIPLLAAAWALAFQVHDGATRENLTRLEALVLSDIQGRKAAQADLSEALERLSEEVSRVGDSGRPSGAPGLEYPARSPDESRGLLDLGAARSLAAGREAFAGLRYAEAAKHFAEAARLDPENREARLCEIASHFYANPSDSSNYGRAERTFSLVLEEDPNDAAALEILARIALERGDWASSSAYFRRLIAAGGADGGALSAGVFAASAAGAGGGRPQIPAGASGPDSGSPPPEGQLSGAPP